MIPSTERQFAYPSSGATRRPAVNPLQPKLLAMLNGDRDIAVRLLRGARHQFPDRLEQWYYEKVINDLTRDRR